MKGNMQVREFFEWLFLLLFVAFVVLLCLFVDSMWQDYKCQQSAEMMEVLWMRTNATGCMILTQDHWVPLDMYRAVK